MASTADIIPASSWLGEPITDASEIERVGRKLDDAQEDMDRLLRQPELPERLFGSVEERIQRHQAAYLALVSRVTGADPDKLRRRLA